MIIRAEIKRIYAVLRSVMTVFQVGDLNLYFFLYPLSTLISIWVADILGQARSATAINISVNMGYGDM
jgi:hypothetical protein